MMHRLNSRFELRESENTNNVVRAKIAGNASSPSFYFSVVPSTFPDTLFKSEDIAQKTRIRDFLYHGYTWNKIREYLSAEIQIKSKISRPSADFAINLNQFSSVADLSSFDQMIEDSIRNTVEYINWKSRLNELEKSQNKWKIYIPSMRYHGQRNQYHDWISSFLSGKSGNSKIDNKPVWIKIKEALNWTLTLSLCSLILIFTLGYFIGEKLFLLKSKRTSIMIDAILFLFDSLPVFFLGMLMIYLFASSTVSSVFHIFPTPGFIDIQPGDSFIKTLSIYFTSLILPIICIVLPSLAYLSRLITNKIKGEYKKPYSFSAWAEGKSDKVITRTEIRKNSILPLISILGMEIPALISGTVLIEILFNIPGMGRLTYQSIVLQDWSIVFHILLLTALFTILGKLLADCLIFIFDHRIKLDPK